MVYYAIFVSNNTMKYKLINVIQRCCTIDNGIRNPYGNSKHKIADSVRERFGTSYTDPSMKADLDFMKEELFAPVEQYTSHGEIRFRYTDKDYQFSKHLLEYLGWMP